MKSKSRYPKLKRGPNGEALCRGCGNLVPKGRQTWCSYQCYKKRCPQMVLMCVRQRDKGICLQCGTNTEELRRSVTLRSGSDYHAIKARSEELASLGWPKSAFRRWWEGDHIIPHSEGGEFVLENIRTLCVICHKKRTAEWRKRKAKIKALL